MNPELESGRNSREALSEEESEALRAKASSYALVNRHSPPF